MSALQYLKGLIEQGLPIDGDPYLTRAVREAVEAIDKAIVLLSAIREIANSKDVFIEDHPVLEDINIWIKKYGTPVRIADIVIENLDNEDAEDEVKGR